MQKGITKQQEENCLDTQAHIVKIKRVKETLKVLHENALEQLENLEEAADKATELNKPRRVWSDETRRRHKASTQG
jgi:hypothetical protein